MMRSFDEHRRELTGLATRLSSHDVPLEDALSLTLARDVLAASDLPPFTNSAMDGYALASATAETAPLRVSQDIPAGRAPAPLQAGTCARIMTGAPLPDGADAVVPVEHTDAGTDWVRIDAWPVPGAHVRARGEDARAGDVVVAAGRRLRPADLAAIAASGVGHVTATRAPRVAIIVTGDELTAPGSERAPAHIYESNGATIAALTQAWGGLVVSRAVIGDNEATLLATLDTIDADLIVTAGAVSAGAYDIVKSALESRGVNFGAVAVQPGRPQGWGYWAEKPIVCLPGNPVSVFTSFVAFVAPMLCTMLGSDVPAIGSTQARADWSSPADRAQVLPVRRVAGGVVPATDGGSRSNLVSRLAAADALALVAADVTQVRSGDTVGIMEMTP